MERTLLLVTGAGRSGTSTAAGALSLLGVHVPGPYLGANASNPRGFYESKWSVDFHNRLLKRAAVSIADGRPEALELLRDAVRDADRVELRRTLAELTVGHRLTAVKDPRTTWTLALWRELADELDLRISTLTMLRHPAEVVGSRATHYSAGKEQLGEQGYAVRNLAGWVNAMLMTERQTRGWQRSFVRYDDLLADWRTALTPAVGPLGVEIPAEQHPVDEFVDPQLSRHPLTWSDVAVPPDLRHVADDVWSGLTELSARHGALAQPNADGPVMDRARERYDAMYLAARQLAHDATVAEVTVAKRTAARAARKRTANPPAPDRSPLRRALARLRRTGR
jgi:hypothetical protein